MNIPNILTVIRLFLVPVFIAVFALEGDVKTASAIIFMSASATDVLDGFIARKFNMSTKVGQLLDPLADKLMQITVVVSLLWAQMVPLWFVLVLASKELLLILGGIFLYKKKTFVKSNVFGKLNTVAMFVAMIAMMTASGATQWMKTVMLIVVSGTNIAAMVSYLYMYFIRQKQFKNYIGKPSKKEATS